MTPEGTLLSNQTFLQIYIFIYYIILYYIILYYILYVYIYMYIYMKYMYNHKNRDYLRTWRSPNLWKLPIFLPSNKPSPPGRPRRLQPRSRPSRTRSWTTLDSEQSLTSPVKTVDSNGGLLGKFPGKPYPLVNIQNSYWKWWFIVGFPIKNDDCP